VRDAGSDDASPRVLLSDGSHLDNQAGFHTTAFGVLPEKPGAVMAPRRLTSVQRITEFQGLLNVGLGNRRIAPSRPCSGGGRRAWLSRYRFRWYRDAYLRARCLVPARGYFEWQTTDGSKQPYYIHPVGNAPALLFAWLWSAVTLPDYEGLTCTVLTEPARTALDAIHDRMPVIVDPDGARTWLEDCETGTVPRLPVAGLTWHAVPRAVGAVRNQGPELIEPVD